MLVSCQAGTSKATPVRHPACRGCIGGAPCPLLQDARACSRCHSAGVCAVYHATAEGGTAASAGLEAGQFEALAGHVTPDHAAWLAHWMALVDWEAAGAGARRAGIWALTGVPGGGACRDGAGRVCSLAGGSLALR